MPLVDLSFSFHQTVGLVIETDDVLAREFFQSEYGPHAGPVGGLPTIRLRFQRREALLSVPAGYTFHAHKLVARWAYHVAWRPDGLSLDCLGNRLSIPMIHHMLVHPSLRLLAARQEVLLLHAGAVSCRGRSLLFTGKGGAGKTTTTALLMAYSPQPWSPHADDYTLLGAGPVSYAYLTRSHLYADLLRWIPSMRSHLSPGERFRLSILGHVRAWSGERIKWPVRVSLNRLWPARPFDLQSRPSGLIFLRRGPVDHPMLEPIIPGEAELNELLEMNFYEARHYLALLKQCAGISELQLSDWRQQEARLINRSLQEIPVYRLILPTRKISAAEFGPCLADLLDGQFAVPEI